MTGTIYHYYARYLVHPSGVTDSLDHWVKALERSNVKARILCATPRGGSDNEFAQESLTRPVGHLGRGRASWIPVGLLWNLRKRDVLVLHEGWVASNVAAALIARWKSTPYIVVPHGVYESGIVDAIRDPLGIRKRMERWVLRGARAVHVFYEGEKDVVRNLEPEIHTFITIANGADAGDVGWSGDGDYFLWIGRFDPHHKGLDNLIRHWANLPAPRPRLIMAGPDFLGGRDEVRTLIEQLALSDSVEVRGRVSGIEKDTLIAGARAYIHPSRWESCSIMLLEALAMGAPALISSSIHAAHELSPRVLRDFPFDDFAATLSEGLSWVDRNAELSQTAVEWSRGAGSWTTLGEKYSILIEKLRDRGSV